MFFIVFASLIIILLTILYYYLTWHFDHWIKRGVIGPKPKPFMGTFPKSSIFLKNFIYDQDEIYR